MNTLADDTEWVAGPLNQLQTQLDHFFESILSLRSVICTIRFKLQYAGIGSEFDLGFEYLSLEATLGILCVAEKNFVENTTEDDLSYGQVQQILSRSIEAIRLAENAINDMNAIR